MEEKEKYFNLLYRLCENIHGAIKIDEILTYLPLSYNGIVANLCDGLFKVVINDKVQSTLYAKDGYFDNIDVLQRLVYKYRIALKSDNAVDKIEFQTKVCKLIKENL